MKALDQFYTVDRLQQKERYYLNFLDKCYGSDITLKESRAPSPLEAVVEQNRLELIMHPTFTRLIQVKWNYFGRTRAWTQLFMNVFLAVVVTTLAVLHPNDVSTYYTPLTQYWWRIVLESFAVLLTFNEIKNEIRDYIQSRNDHHLWKKWKVANLQRDVKFCHPSWPQEKKFIESLILSARLKRRRYFHDKSNFVDWLAYFMLLIAFILHYMNISIHYFNSSKLVDTKNDTQQPDLHLEVLGQTSKELNQIYLRFISFTLIVIWIRLLKYCRPFQITGPFVAILSHMITASLKWSFVFAAFYIPYTASFWIMFGGNTERPVQGYNTVDSLLFNVLQITLVGDYNFSELAQVAPITARILCGSFLFFAAIVLLNLFIALMSDTFQRVHDNARATAAIQRAHFIQGLESEASNRTQQRYRKFLLLKCSPDEVDLNRKSVEDENDRIHNRLSNLEEQMTELKGLLLERTLNPNEKSIVDMMNNRLSNIESVLKYVQESGTLLSNPTTIFTARYKKKPHDSELPTETRERGQRRNPFKSSKETKKKREEEGKITGKLKKFWKAK